MTNITIGSCIKDHTFKLKRNEVLRLPSSLDINQKVMLRFLRLLTVRLPYYVLF